MKELSLQSLMQDFDPAPPPNRNRLNEGGTVTIWLSKDQKDRYDRIQQTSNRQFTRKIREIIIAAMDLAEEKSAD